MFIIPVISIQPCSSDVVCTALELYISTRFTLNPCSASLKRFIFYFFSLNTKREALRNILESSNAQL
jgi:hypothetical protein